MTLDVRDDLLAFTWRLLFTYLCHHLSTLCDVYTSATYACVPLLLIVIDLALVIVMSGRVHNTSILHYSSLC